MRKIIYVLLLALFASCSSSVMNKPYSEKTLQEDMVEIKKELSEEDFEILTGYILLAAFTEEKNLGKTYNDLLKEGQEMQAEADKQEAEAKALAEKAKAAELDRIKRLGDALTVSLFEKGFLEHSYSEYITYKFALENKTEKNIKAFKGKVLFRDLFDEDIYELGLTFDDGLPANYSGNWDVMSDYNQFMDADVLLKSKGIEDMKITWVPEKIIFEDGTTLE